MTTRDGESSAGAGNAGDSGYPIEIWSSWGAWEREENTGPDGILCKTGMTYNKIFISNGDLATRSAWGPSATGWTSCHTAKTKKETWHDVFGDFGVIGYRWMLAPIHTGRWRSYQRSDGGWTAAMIEAWPEYTQLSS